jgi:hypothetical protein
VSVSVAWAAAVDAKVASRQTTARPAMKKRRRLSRIARAVAKTAVERGGGPLPYRYTVGPGIALRGNIFSAAAIAAMRGTAAGSRDINALARDRARTGSFRTVGAGLTRRRRGWVWNLRAGRPPVFADSE